MAVFYHFVGMLCSANLLLMLCCLCSYGIRSWGLTEEFCHLAKLYYINIYIKHKMAGKRKLIMTSLDLTFNFVYFLSSHWMRHSCQQDAHTLKMTRLCLLKKSHQNMMKCICAAWIDAFLGPEPAKLGPLERKARGIMAGFMLTLS